MEELETVTTTVIKTGATEMVSVEDLLMDLGTAQAVLDQLCSYLEELERTDHAACVVPPSDWALAGARRNLGNVSHALRCLCWGHSKAILH